MHVGLLPEPTVLFCREQRHTFSGILRSLCGWATNQLEALSVWGGADPHPRPHLATQRPTHPADRQRSADQWLSESCGCDPVNLTRLSIVLSSVQTAARGGQCAWTQQTGAHQVLQLLHQVAKEHGGLINKAVDEACRWDSLALYILPCIDMIKCKDIDMILTILVINEYLE